jgi:hypothetical protein
MSMWPMLLGLVVAVLVVSFLSPAARRGIGGTAAVVVGLAVVAIGAEVIRSVARLRQDLQAQKRIAASEVRLDDLELSGNSPATYRLTGLVHNLSPTYTLTDVRLGFIVEGCVERECHQQARGHAEVIHRVPPNQTATFSTQIVSVENVAAPLGQPRLTYRVYLTVGQ